MHYSNIILVHVVKLLQQNIILENVHYLPSNRVNIFFPYILHSMHGRFLWKLHGSLLGTSHIPLVSCTITLYCLVLSSLSVDFAACPQSNSNLGVLQLFENSMAHAVRAGHLAKSMHWSDKTNAMSEWTNLINVKHFIFYPQTGIPLVHYSSFCSFWHLMSSSNGQIYWIAQFYKQFLLSGYEHPWPTSHSISAKLKSS